MSTQIFLLAFSNLGLRSLCNGKCEMDMLLAGLIGRELAFKCHENLMLQLVLKSHTHPGSVCQALYADPFQRANLPPAGTHTQRETYTISPFRSNYVTKTFLMNLPQFLSHEYLTFPTPFTVYKRNCFLIYLCCY